MIKTKQDLEDLVTELFQLIFVNVSTFEAAAASMPGEVLEAPVEVKAEAKPWTLPDSDDLSVLEEKEAIVQLCSKVKKCPKCRTKNDGRAGDDFDDLPTATGDVLDGITGRDKFMTQVLSGNFSKSVLAVKIYQTCQFFLSRSLL